MDVVGGPAPTDYYSGRDDNGLLRSFPSRVILDGPEWLDPIVRRIIRDEIRNMLDEGYQFRAWNEDGEWE